MKRQDKKAEIELLDRLLAMDSYAFDSDLRNRERQLDVLQLTVSSDQRILDAGCGPGTYGIILAQSGHEVIGIDISANAAAVAKERADGKRVKFLPVVGDLERLPFNDGSFDICFCGYTLHHFPDINSVVAEFARVVKPNGKIVLLEPNGSNPAVRLSETLESLVRGWLFKLGIDSPNEVIHRHSVYAEALDRQGFVDIEVDSSCTGGVPPLPTKHQKHGVSYFSLFVIRTVARLRRVFYVAVSKVLPRPLNGFDLVITATKRQ